MERPSTLHPSRHRWSRVLLGSRDYDNCHCSNLAILLLLPELGHLVFAVWAHFQFPFPFPLPTSAPFVVAHVERQSLPPAANYRLGNIL